MSRIIYRQLAGLQDLAVGHNAITQERGDKVVDIREIELEFIFRTVVEIRELSYLAHEHTALYVANGPLIRYYFDATSTALDDGDNVLKPLTILATQPGRYIKADGVSAVFDTIISSCSDEYTPIEISAGTPERTFRAPYALDLTNGYVRIDLTTAVEGTQFIVDLHMNGVTMFSTLLHIDTLQDTSVSSGTQAVLSVTSIPDNAKFEVYVIQVGTAVAGTGLNIAITGTKVP